MNRVSGFLASKFYAKEIRRLRRALRKYGAHEFNCGYLNYSCTPCNCGLAKALKVRKP